MRIIVRYCLPWGNFSTQAIDIDPDALVEVLQSKIFDKFGIAKNRQLIKFKRDGYTVRVIPGWSLSFYEIKEKAILYLDSLDNLYKDDESQALESIRMTGRYYAKLGILSTIKDEDEEEEETKTKGVIKMDSGNYSDEGSDVESESGDKKRKTKEEQLFKDTIEKFLKEVKQGNMDSIATFYQTIQENYKDDDPEEKIRNLINENGSGGWNSLHFAIFVGHQQVVKDLIDRGVNINKQTSDGWTPLQLAVHKNNLEIGKMLVKCPGLDVNLSTSKTTALHIAAKNGRLPLVQMLLQCKADIHLKNEDGMLPFEVTTNEEIRRALDFESMRQSDLRRTVNEEFRPPKPPIIKGWLHKLGALIVNVKVRYFVVNPDQGTFMRYRSLADYPNKPIEIIPLRDITNVKKISNSWLFRKNLTYFEVAYSSRIILGAVNDDTATQWVTFLYQSVVYSNWVDQKLKEDLKRLERSSDEEIRLEHDIEHRPNEEVEIIDEIRRELGRTDSIVAPQIGSTTPSSTDTSSKSPKVSPIGNSPKTPNGVVSDRNRSATNFRLATEDPKDKDLDNPRANMKRHMTTTISDMDLKLDEKLNFQSFEVLKQLGSGAFGKVYKVKKRDDGKIYAMKALKKRNLIMKNQLRYAVTEANVLRTANHPFILGLHYAFQTPQYLYLVLDYCPGGDLSLHLAQRVTFEEADAKFYVAELIVAVDHLHSMNVIYRDLKPENILIAADGHVKLADFGLSKEGVADEDNAKSFCGSPAYLSPEMLKNKGVGKAADIYGIGTVLYEMLCGNSPYYSDDIPKMYSNIRKGKLSFPKYISESAKNLTIKLLNRDPNHRIGVKDKNDLKRDPFFKDIDWDKLLRKEYPPPKLDDFSDSDDDTVGSKQVHNDFDYDEKNKKANRVNNFTFIKKGF